MNINLNNKVGALFKLKVHKGDDVAIQETPWFHNEVLNSGLDRMSVGTWINQCCVGAGSSLPISSQTQLDNFIATTTSTQSSSQSRNTGEAPYYISKQITWRFGQGVAAGNLSEVGLGWGSQNLWNRALIKDINGNPTTITVLSDEYLDVVSEVRVYFETNFTGLLNLFDKNNQIISTHTISGIPYIVANPSDSVSFEKVTLRSFGIYSGSVTSVASDPTNPLLSTGIPAGNYPSERQYIANYPVDLSSGNGVHKSFVLRGNLLDHAQFNNGYQFQIDPPITKTNAQIMNYTLSVSWGRYESP